MDRHSNPNPNPNPGPDPNPDPNPDPDPDPDPDTNPDPNPDPDPDPNPIPNPVQELTVQELTWYRCLRPSVLGQDRSETKKSVLVLYTMVLVLVLVWCCVVKYDLVTLVIINDLDRRSNVSSTIL